MAIQDLSIRFSLTSQPDIVAVDGFDLDIQEGEFVCIMGPSGCGKSSLLNAIAGFVMPSAGRIMMGGVPVSGPSAERAMVFQSDALFPWMTVEENIGFAPRMRGHTKPQIREIVDKYIGLIGLSEFRGAWPRELSGGMKKRVDVARGYAADPKVLLLDEPFGALDIVTKEYLQEELYRLWTTAPRTMVFVTHDVEEALFLGERIVVMSPRPGRIEAIYSPSFPRDRSSEFKLDPDFIALRREVHQAMTAFETDT